MAELMLDVVPTKVQPGKPVAFTITFIDDILAFLQGVYVNFGDGSDQWIPVFQYTTYWSTTITHSYSSDGVYVAQATAGFSDARNIGGATIYSNPVTILVLVEAPIPPPPTLPPPITPVPVRPEPPVIILEPWEPDERERPITLPPPVKPEPPDWRPGPLPPDIVPPPRTRDTDIMTLRQFAVKWGHQIERYALNVPLDGGEVVEELEEPYRSFWARLTTHKADIVFVRKGILYVAEIKPRLSRGAIGEAITAHLLFKRLHRPQQETRAAVICQTAHPTLLQTAAWLDCLVFVTEQVDTGEPAGLYRRIGR